MELPCYKMATDVKKLPEYKTPPVIELVCGVLFQPLQKFLTPHLGLLWEKFKEEYPIPKDIVPLPPVVETFGGGFCLKVGRKNGAGKSMS